MASRNYSWLHKHNSVFALLSQGVSSLPDFVEFKKFPGIPLKDIFSAAGDDLLDLLDRFLDCNPPGRVTASQVNNHTCKFKTILHINTSCLIHLVNFVNNVHKLRPINEQYLSHMCTSASPNTNKVGLMYY